MTNKKLSKDTVGKILLFGSVILIGVVAAIYTQWIKTLPQRYSVGQVLKIWKPAKGDFLILYSYTIDSTTYKNSIDLDDYRSIAKPGARFIVSIPIDHNSHGIMFLDKPVPNGIEPPVEGWKKKPSFKQNYFTK